MVAVKENKIFAVTDGSDVKDYLAAKIIDANGDIVMPGLINTHTHVSMTVFRSMADDVPDRLHRYIFPLEKKNWFPVTWYVSVLSWGTLKCSRAG